MHDNSEHGKYPPEILGLLRSAGWYEGRDAWEIMVLPAQYEVFPRAQEVVAEFGGLHIGKTGPGLERAKSDIEFDPALASHLTEDVRRYESSIGTKLYPLGEVHRGHAYLIIDEHGRLYLLNDELLPVATTFANGLEKLLLGKRLGFDT